jgi:hypothetical protein
MNRIETLSPNLTQLRQRLEDWRQQRSGRSRIPTHFWTEALALARIEGVSRVSRILRLHYQRLKTRLTAPLPNSTRIAAPALHESRECRVEMMHRTGAKMTMHLPAVSASHLLPLAHAFWSQRR